MKKILLATTVLVGTAGIAAAEVTLSGSARMGVVNSYSLDAGDNVSQFSSRIRVNFGLAGETDGGLSFGASVRADQAGTANSGGTAMDAGSVFVSGAFGKISMGDNDSAANATVGQVDGVGYTGNGDWNEIAYIGQTDTSVLYTYAAGDLSVAASVGQLDGDTDYNGDDVQAYSVAAAYAMGDYKLMAGYESGNKAVYSFETKDDAYAADPESSYLDRFDLTEHYVLGGDATFGAFTAKARVGIANGQGYADSDYPVDGMQYALSGTYKMDALSFTAFYAASDIAYHWAGDDSDYGFETARYGLGVSSALGGGAAASVGYSHVTSDNNGGDLITYPEYDTKWSDNRYEAGLTFSF